MEPKILEDQIAEARVEVLEIREQYDQAVKNLRRLLDIRKWEAIYANDAAGDWRSVLALLGDTPE